MKEPRPLRRDKCVRWLTFGIPGAGKTRLLATGQRTLIIRPPTDHTDSVDFKTDAEEIEVTDHTELLETYQWVQQGGGDKYDWIWLDGITLFEEYGMDDVFQAAIDRKPERKEFGPDKGEYGINRGRLSRHIRDMVGLSKQGMFNYGVTANLMQVYDPHAEDEIWVPQYGSPKGGGKDALKLCGYMNIVAYMYKTRPKEGKAAQHILTVDSDGFVGKDQYNCFPTTKSGKRAFINPTMQDIAEALESTRRPTRKTSTRKTTARKRTTTRRKRAR